MGSVEVSMLWLGIIALLAGVAMVLYFKLEKSVVLYLFLLVVVSIAFVAPLIMPVISFGLLTTGIFVILRVPNAKLKPLALAMTGLGIILILITIVRIWQPDSAYSKLMALSAPVESYALADISGTPINCSASNSELNITTRVESTDQMSAQRLYLSGSGFIPEEMLSVNVNGAASTGGTGGHLPKITVDSEGKFTTIELLTIIEPQMHWQIKIIHQRGVICTDFTTH